MKFGVALFSHGPLASADNMMRTAQRAEALGFDSVAVSDHIVLPRQDASNYPYHPEGRRSWRDSLNYYEPIAALGFLAGVTSRVRLGVSVLVVPYRNPITTAKQLASIDALSGGRLFMGVGTGWWAEEFAALGIPDHFAERGPRTDEYIDIWRNLWREENPAYQGKYYSYADLEFSPRPAQRDGIPIWVGGHTGRALRRTAALGDVWHPIGQVPPADLPPGEIGEKAEQLKELTRAAGREPGSIPIHFRTPISFQEGPGYFAGSPDKLCESVQAYAAAGVSQIMINLPPGEFAQTLEALERFGEEVLPRVS